jgi:hypothetical protein
MPDFSLRGWLGQAGEIWVDGDCYVHQAWAFALFTGCRVEDRHYLLFISYFKPNRCINKSYSEHTFPKIPTQGSRLCPNVITPYFPVFLDLSIRASFALLLLYNTFIVPSSSATISNRYVCPKPSNQCEHEKSEEESRDTL